MTTLLTRRTTMAGFAAAVPGFALARVARAAETRSLVGVIEEDPPIMNPAITSVISSYVVACPVYSALTRMDVDGKVTGDLAESWEISPDGLVYTFHLRKSVLWHDGEPFTAADAKFSLGEATSKLHPFAAPLRGVKSYEAPNDFTFIMRLAQPENALIKMIHNYAGCILPRHLWEGTDFLKNPRNKAPIGTGAFKFVRYDVGDRVTLAKNEHYFLPGLPVFDEVVFRIIPDPSARVAAFENGEVDVMYSSAVPATQVERLSKLPGVAMKPSTVAAAAYIGYINMRNAPYSDVRVRHALAHAIDRGFIRSSVLPGMSENMVGPVAPSNPLYNKELKDYALDPARAEQLLDEAGYKKGADGTRFEFRYLFGVNDLTAAKMGEIMGRNLAAVGIKPVLTPLERGTWISRSFTAYEFDMTVGSFALGPDPDIGTERLYNSNNIKDGAPFVNSSPYHNPEVDKLFDAQRVEIDFAKRKAIYDKIQELIWADLPIFPICAYAIPGAVRASYVANVFEEEASTREDFVFAKLVGKS
jgi:peptide/nickel transport system substrate-binding protein